MKMPIRKSPGEGKKEVSDPMHQEKRSKNNVAVKKSREKSKQKTELTRSKVDMLKKENEALEDRITLLSKELSFLRDILSMHIRPVHDVNDAYLGLENILKDSKVRARLMQLS